MPTVPLRSFLAASLLAFPLAGCGSIGQSLGDASPSFQSAGVRALGNGLIGQDAAGRKLPADARASALSAEYKALQFSPAGEAVAWSADGYSGEVVPTQLYRIGDQDCRGYSQTFHGAGPATKAVGAACKSQSGYWTPVA